MKNLVALLACLALMQAVCAFDESEISAQGSVYLNQDQIVLVGIENNSLEDRGLEVEFIGPAGMYYEFSGVPDEIKASDSREISLWLMASPGMEGTTYDSTIIVKLGNETALKGIKLHVSKVIPYEPTPTPTEEEDGVTPYGFFSLGFLAGYEGIITYALAAAVIVLALIFTAKFLSLERNRRRYYHE